MAQYSGRSRGALSRYNTPLRTIFQVARRMCITNTTFLTACFRWRKSENDIWSCALHGRLLSLRQDVTHLHYTAAFLDTSEVLPSPPPSASSSTVDSLPTQDDTETLVQHYLNLGPNLKDLYETWSRADLNFKKKAPKFTGVRILKQDAWEALVGFICSSNNNIIRISQMASSPSAPASDRN